MGGMDKHTIRRGSHLLSKLLRFSGREVGLTVDPAGWVPLGEVLRVARLSRADVEAIVKENNKARFQLDDERIRACQGHGVRLGVDPVALEQSWEVYTGPDSIWHGTRIEALPAIAEAGLLPGDRTHVHLAEAPDSRVGKRAHVAVLLEVSAKALRLAGLHVFRSANGVVLVRRVPPACIVGLRCLSSEAQRSQPELLRLFSLAADGATAMERGDVS